MLYSVIKRIFDFIVAIIAMIVFAIPWIIISIIIKIKSPGPVIFKAKRVGIDGKPFTLYKFRSMRADNKEISVTTLKGDDRIYPFGEFLRKTKLDETPQFINILKGEMTIIGPRPEDMVNAKDIYVGKYKKVLSVKPGLSSPASLYDYVVGEQYTDVELYESEFIPQKLELELYYIDHRNCFYDLKLIFETIMQIFRMVFGKKLHMPSEVKKCNIIPRYNSNTNR